MLLQEKALVFAHDPKAEENMKKEFPEITYADSPQKIIDSSEIVLILTDWPDFSSLDFKDKLVFDARKIFNELKPLNYEGLCW